MSDQRRRGIARIEQRYSVLDAGVSFEGAACTDVNPSVFFPPAGDNGHEAKRICAVCPIKQQCLEYAMQFPDLLGIWGGVNVRTRRQLRHRRARLGKNL